jgi:hypothetical protein
MSPVAMARNDGARLAFLRHNAGDRARVQDINITVAHHPERMLDVRRSSIDIVEQCRT